MAGINCHRTLDDCSEQSPTLVDSPFACCGRQIRGQNSVLGGLGGSSYQDGSGNCIACSDTGNAKERADYSVKIIILVGSSAAISGHH